MKIRQNMLPKSKWGIKSPYTMKPSRIVVHNTANDASAYNEISYMVRNDNQISFHYAIDDKEIVQGISEDRNGWHSGDGAKGKGNREGIAIEICYSKSGGVKFEKAEKLAAEFIASKLIEYGWGIDKVTKHQDYSGKYCPHRTLDLGWQRFLDMIKMHLNDDTHEVCNDTINDLKAENERLNAENKVLHDDVELRKIVNNELHDKIHLLEARLGEMPKAIFECGRSDKYIIRLDKCDILYIKKD